MQCYQDIVLNKFDKANLPAYNSSKQIIGCQVPSFKTTVLRNHISLVIFILNVMIQIDLDCHLLYTSSVKIQVSVNK